MSLARWNRRCMLHLVFESFPLCVNLPYLVQMAPSYMPVWLLSLLAECIVPLPCVLAVICATFPLYFFFLFWHNTDVPRALKCYFIVCCHPTSLFASFDISAYDDLILFNSVSFVCMLWSDSFYEILSHCCWQFLHCLRMYFHMFVCLSLDSWCNRYRSAVMRVTFIRLQSGWSVIKSSSHVFCMIGCYVYSLPHQQQYHGFLVSHLLTELLLYTLWE